MRIKMMLLAVAGLSLLAGCKKAEESVVRDEDGTINIATASTNLVLAEVGNKQITVSDFRKRIELEGEILRVASTRTGKELEDAIKKASIKKAASLLPTLIVQEVLEEYWKDNNLTVTNEAEIIKQTLKVLKAGKLNLDEMAKKLGVEGEYLRGQILYPEKLRLAAEHFDPECRMVSEQEIDDGLARMQKYYEMAVATNRLTWANCSNVLHKVQQGMDFEEAGKQYGEETIADAKYWEGFVPWEMENEQLKNWAFSAPVGSVGGPFDLEDGLSIVKILSRQDGAMTNAMAAKQTAYVELARITFRMLVEEPEPRTREYVAKTLKKWKEDNAKDALIEKLKVEKNVKYPNGTEYKFDIIRK